MKFRTLEPCGLFTTKDFEEGVQTLDMTITDMSAYSLHYWLSKFIQEASNSLAVSAILLVCCYSILCRLKHHLSDLNGSASLNMSDKGKLYF